MTVSSALDSAGRRRSPATLPGFHSGRAPRNKGMLYPADPPTVEEIVGVMRHASEDPHGFGLRAMIVMLWRGGLRVQEALALSEYDLDPQLGSVPVRCGKGGRRREVGMDRWSWENLRPWQQRRHQRRRSLPLTEEKQARRPCNWRFPGLAVGRRADLLSAVRGAHDTGESRVAIPGAGIAACGDQHALSASREAVVSGRRRPLLLRGECGSHCRRWTITNRPSRAEPPMPGVCRATMT